MIFKSPFNDTSNSSTFQIFQWPIRAVSTSKKAFRIANKIGIDRKSFFAVVSPVLQTGDRTASLRSSEVNQFLIIELATSVTSPKHKAELFENSYWNVAANRL